MIREADPIGFVNSIAKIPLQREETDFEKNGIMYCGKCGEPRQAWIDWFPDKDGNPTKNLVRIMCRCDFEREAKEKDRQAQMEFESNQSRMRLALRTLRDDVRWRFEMDDAADSPVAKTCRQYVSKWEDVKRENFGILFYGSKGSGKTFYASCIYNALQEKRVLVGFTSAPNLMAILGKWDKTEVLDAVTRAHLLVVDDLGAERDNSYSAELMYSVIDARYKTGKPTIITTNLDLEEMKTEDDVLRSRIYDRVIEMCPLPIKMVGASRRSEIADERKKKAMELLRWTKKEK